MLPQAFADADEIIIGAVARASLLEEQERLNPGALASQLMSMNKEAFYEPSVDEIILKLQRELQPGDVVVMFSNGSFEGLGDRLIKNLEEKR